MKGYILRLAELARPATTNATANAVMVETGGKILVTGTAQENYLHSDGSGYYQVELALVQYQSDGALDPTFGSDGVALPFVTSGATSDGYALATLSSGNIAVAGQIEDSSGGHDVFVTDYSVATTPSNVYTYDVRNEMTTVTVSGVTTNYIYNDSGDRVSETTSGTTTAYLFNTANPTGYDQELEDTTTTGSTTTRTTYFIGLDVYGQATGSTIYYLMRDGHGNTRLITNSGGEILADYNYDAFSDPVNFDPATAYTTHLTSDGVYDVATTFEYQLARWRNSFEWTQEDGQGYGDNSEPITLNSEIYGDGDPVQNGDPSGHFISSFGLGQLYSAMNTYNSVVNELSSAATETNDLGNLETDAALDVLETMQEEIQEGTGTDVEPQPNLNNFYFHYTDSRGAALIFATQRITASRSYPQYNYPSGAYATNISPYTIGMTQNQLARLLYWSAGRADRADVSWCDIIEDDFGEFQFVAPFEYAIPAPAGSGVPVHVVAVVPNRMSKY